MIGRVVSTKTKDTATVLVERVAKHPLYKKTFIRTKKYLVDTKIPIKEGDMVLVERGGNAKDGDIVIAEIRNVKTFDSAGQARED